MESAEDRREKVRRDGRARTDTQDPALQPSQLAQLTLGHAFDTEQLASPLV